MNWEHGKDFLLEALQAFYGFIWDLIALDASYILGLYMWIYGTAGVAWIIEEWAPRKSGHLNVKCPIILSEMKKIKIEITITTIHDLIIIKTFSCLCPK